jgi:hyaluronate lyase
MWVPHGKNPVNATYAYVLLPGKNVSETGRYAKNPNIAILSNTPQVQAVTNKSEGVTGWNFWEVTSQPIAGLLVDTPASIIIKETADELIIGISDPTQKAKTITIELNRSVSGVSVKNPDIKIISLAPLKIHVSVDSALGCTRSITLNIKKLLPLRTCYRLKP